ncbi:putative amidohydrolase YtcJ [Arthrobacter sp. CAN_A212]|uniref:amidohydrolase n=1 Tax=Arthrobacter sp. CAN_A212 TaxID=2787719 RepID=UPI0018CBDE2E
MQLDLILTNSRIITMDPARPTAGSLGILNGRIVGLDDDLAGLAAREVVDLHGKVLIPGLNDAHCHTAWFGLTLGEVDLSPLTDLDQVYALLHASAETRPAGEGDDGGWLVASGFDHHRFGGRFPDRAALDRVAAGRPLFIRRTSGHGGIANTEALRRAGVLVPGFADPVGGRVVRDELGEPTGLLQETAQALVLDLLRPYPRHTLLAAIDRATSRYAREGITSFTDAGVGGGWIGHAPDELGAFQDARAAGKLHARAQLMPAIETLQTVPGAGLGLGMYSGFGDSLLSLGPAKIFLDGALSSETAAQTVPYATGSSNKGYLLDEPVALQRQMLDAHRAGWSIAAHAIGDAAIDLAIDTFTQLRTQVRAGHEGPARLPHRIEHAAVVRPDQLEVLAALGVAVAPQASFFHPIGDAMARSLGPRRSAFTYRAKSFLDAGIRLAGSSDRPCADGTALRSLQAYVDRLTSSGTVFGSAAERLSAAEALRIHTVGSADATGFGRVKGMLAAGMLADCAVLAESPLDVPTHQIADIEVLATLMGGRFTHYQL